MPATPGELAQARPPSSCRASAISRRRGRSTDRVDASAIRASVDDRPPLLGICLGMQWLFEGSEEAPELSGPRPALAGEC